MAVLDRKELQESPLSDLHAIASELGIEGYRLLRKEKLIDAILGQEGGPQPAAGGDEEPQERPRQRRSRGGRGRKRSDEDEGPAEETESRGPRAAGRESEDEEEPGEVRT